MLNQITYMQPSAINAHLKKLILEFEINPSSRHDLFIWNILIIVKS